MPPLRMNSGPYGPTNEWETKEFMRCAADCNYFLNTYGHILDPIKGDVPFALFEYQAGALYDFRTRRFNVALKPRQMGLSWLVQGFALHMILFDFGKDIREISVGEREAMELLEKAKYIYGRLPRFLQVDPKEIRENETMLEFTRQKSKIVCIPTSKNAGRSAAASLLVLDEAAFIRWADIIWAAAYPTLSQGGSAILISTANGVGNLFHRLWSEAEKGENDFHPIKLHWRQFPGRDDAWYQLQLRNLGKLRTAQEVDCDFLQSGNPVFDSDYLYVDNRPNLRASIIIPKTLEPGVKIYQEPIPERRYLIGGDVAEGGGLDYSVLSVLDSITFEEVALLRGKWPTSVFAAKVDFIARKYPGMVAVERNNHGHAVLQRLSELGTPGLYWHQEGESWNSTPKLGWITSRTTKPLMIDELEEAMRNGYIRLASPKIIGEMLVYAYLDNGKTGAPKGYNDDCVIALAIAFQMRKYMSSLQYASIDM